MPRKAKANADQILAYINQHIATYGCIPKNIEIVRHFNLKSEGLASHYIRILADRGSIILQERYKVAELK